jgi:hypothetical protein
MIRSGGVFRILQSMAWHSTELLMTVCPKCGFSVEGNESECPASPTRSELRWAAGARLVLATGLLLLAGCHDVQNEQDQIYRAVLDHIFPTTSNVKPSTPLVSSQPEAPSAQEMQGLFEGYQCHMAVSESLKESFSRANDSKPPLLRRLDLFRDVTLVPPDRYRDAAGHISRDRLFKHYGEKSGNFISLPSSLIIFSGVGFDRRGRRALVYVVSVGYEGRYFLLEKNGQWRVTDQCRVWVA